jgi:transposase
MQTDASFWDSLVFDGIDDVDVEAVTAAFGTIDVVARGRAAGANCPDCGLFSGRVHDCYQRRLKDLPLGGQSVVILLTVRRFICDAAHCPRRTFAEPFTQLTAPYARFTTRLNHILERVGLALAGRAGARLATDIFGVSGRSMLEALIAGQRDPRVLAELARGSMVVKKAALAEALTGQFEDHHAFLCRTLLDTIDYPGGQIETLTTRTTTALQELPCPDTEGNLRAGPGPDPVEKLVAISGVGLRTAQVLLAELGPDMRVFPTADHLVSWAKFAPRTIQSGGKNTSGPTGKGNPWVKNAVGEAALSASRSNTFLGARYKRIVKRRGRKRALVAVGHSLLVIVWHLLNDSATPYTDLGSDYHQRLLDPDRRTRDLVRQLKALGHDVTLTPSPEPFRPRASKNASARPQSGGFSVQALRGESTPCARRPV